VGARIIGAVKKTSLYLDPDVERALARLAGAQGVTKAELIRRVLAHAVSVAGTPRPSARGVFDGPHDLSTAVDSRLADTGFGER